MIRPLAITLLSACTALTTPGAAQTVIYPDSPPPRTDSAPQPSGARADTARPDTVRRDTTTPAPPYGISPAPRPPAAAPPPEPPSPPVDPVLATACTGSAPGESAPDLLGIVFERGAAPSARETALAAVGGKRLGGSAEDQFQYVQVPASGSEFRLRALADKLIRLSGVSEVGPVTCPSVSPPRAAPAPPARRDSANS
jgi:hypothetical protein